MSDAQNRREALNAVAARKEELEQARLQFREARRRLWEAERAAKSVRTCCDCGKPIERAHKWHFVEFKTGSRIAHRNCDDPDAYVPDLACDAVKRMRRIMK